MSERRLLPLVLGMIVVAGPIAGAIGVGVGAATATTADGAPSLVGAVELAATGQDSVGANTHTDSVIEVSFDGPIRQARTGDRLNRSAVTVLVNGEDVTDRYTLDDDGSRAASTPGQVVLSSDVEVTPYDTVVVEFDSLTGPDATGQTGRVRTQATVTDGVVSESGADGNPDTAEIGVFAGAPLAVVADDGEGDTNAAVRVERSQYGFVTSGTTGRNSQVYTFKTKERNESAIYRFDMTADPGDTDDNVPAIRYYDLDIETTIEPSQLAPGGTVEVTVSAEAPGRRFNVVLNGPDDFKRTKQVELGAQPQAGTTVEFGPLDRTGSYKANAKDRLTDKNQKSANAEVTRGSASLEGDLFTDQRGDVVEIPISVSATDSTRVRVGSAAENYRATLQVTDGNDDDTVTVEWNTFRADGEGDGVGEAFAPADDDDTVTVRRVTTDVTGGDAAEPDLLAAAGYDVAVAADGDLDTPEGAGVVDLRPRATTGLAAYRAPARLADEFDETDGVRAALRSGNLTEGASVARGDLLVFRLSATGLEGALGETDDATAAVRALSEQLSLSLVEVDPPLNEQPVAVRLTDESTRVIADGANDTYFVIVDTGLARTVPDTGPRGADRQAEADATGQPLGADTALRANVTVGGPDGGLATDRETVLADATVVDPEFEVGDEDDYPIGIDGMTVETATTLAPGSEVTVRVRGVDTESASYLKTAETRVAANGSVRASFDANGVTIGDEVRVSLDGQLASATVDGRVADLTESTPTPTRTPTPTPTPTATVSSEPTPTPSATPTATSTPASESSATQSATSTPGTATDVATATDAGAGAGPGNGGLVPLGGVAVVIAAVLGAGFLFSRE